MKLVLRERETDDAREVFVSASRVRSSRLLFPEVCAAVSRARRIGRIPAPAAVRALESIRALFGGVEPIELDAALADRAGELAVDHGLRGYDAVHLASYELIETPASVLVAADGELVRAARSLGHAVATLER